jgi:molecular chaperone Hsp33
MLFNVLISLGKEDLDSLVADGKAEVSCHFCNEKYEFTGEELQELAAAADKVR